MYGELKADNVKVGVIHSDLTQQQRDDVVKAFREGNVWMLICTELISRGIDFKGVNLVLNYDFPPTAISYIHRIGRTGRAGRKGKAITYFTQSDTIILKRYILERVADALFLFRNLFCSIANVMKTSGCPVPDYMLTMKNRSKREKKRLLKNKEKREDISRSHTYGVAAPRRHKPVMVKRAKGVAKSGSSNTEESAPKVNYVSLKRKNVEQQNGTSRKKRKNL